MADVALRPLLVAVAALFLSASVAHSDSLDDQFLGSLSADGVNFSTPEHMIARGHERCHDNQLGHDRAGLVRGLALSEARTPPPCLRSAPNRRGKAWTPSKWTTSCATRYTCTARVNKARSEIANCAGKALHNN
jgi:Protein of unknown function (DUF732)